MGVAILWVAVRSVSLFQDIQLLVVAFEVKNEGGGVSVLQDTQLVVAAFVSSLR